MMRLRTYTIALYLAAPLLLAWMGWRARRAGGRWDVLSRARFGCYRHAPDSRRPVWVHAASLGEMRAAAPLVTALLAEGYVLLLTFMTATGRAEAERLFQAETADGRVTLQWLPYDFPGATRRFLAHAQPEVGVLIERELWPNLLAAARRIGLPMMLASGRLSARSLASGLRAGQVLRQAYAGLTVVHAQTEIDADHLRKAGAQAVTVSGNLKFDMAAPESQWAQGRALATALRRPVVVLASTREGEDAPFIAAWAAALSTCVKSGVQPQLNCGALGESLDSLAEAGLEAEARSHFTVPMPAVRPLLLLVPRHPQRFEAAARLLNEAGLSFRRRSEMGAWDEGEGLRLRDLPNLDVILGDSLGEMALFYGAGTVAIVAGSFAPLGGQNIIEASAAGLPVIVGPHTRNFAQAVEDAAAAGALRRVETPAQAVALALQWLEDAAARQACGEAGRRWVQSHAGTTRRLVEAISALCEMAGGYRDGAGQG